MRIDLGSPGASCLGKYSSCQRGNPCGIQLERGAEQTLGKRHGERHHSPRPALGRLELPLPEREPARGKIGLGTLPSFACSGRHRSLGVAFRLRHDGVGMGSRLQNDGFGLRSRFERLSRKPAPLRLARTRPPKRLAKKTFATNDTGARGHASLAASMAIATSATTRASA